ncbi:MAG: NmrA family NAD(P)-binding protein [Lautropia sp.]
MIGVIGATGIVGSLLIRRLSDKGLPTRALVHRPEMAKKVDLPYVETRRGNFKNDDDMRQFLRNVDQVFLLTPIADDMIEVQQHLVDLAREVGVAGITKLSVWTAAADASLWFSRAHHAIENHLRDSGVPHTILQPRTFMQTMGAAFCDEVRTHSSISSIVEPDVGIYMVDLRDVVDVAAEILARGEHKGETVVIHGPQQLTYPECARLLSTRLGREIKYNLISEQEVIENFSRVGKRQRAEILITVWRNYNSRNSDPEILSTAIADWTGHQPRCYDDYLDESIDLFR